MSKPASQKGFTILELLIATMVFSVILLLVTYGIIQIGNRYYKATLQSQTQAATRNAIDEIGRNLQFSTGDVKTAAVVGGIGAYCINNTQYAYVLGQPQDQSSNFKHVLVARPEPDNCVAPDPTFFQGNLQPNERDLLGDRMRLITFDISRPSPNGVIPITLRVVTGENDLLCSPMANDCNSTGISANLSNTDVQCKAGPGSTYCAYSELSTAVTRRLAQ